MKDWAWGWELHVGEVEKYWETHWSIICFGLFTGFVKYNINVEYFPPYPLMKSIEYRNLDDSLLFIFTSSVFNLTYLTVSLSSDLVMSQVEKKAGLLRRTSSSKKPLKEKVVLMYDEIFAVSITMGECQWWEVKRNKMVLKCKQSPLFVCYLERRPSQKQPSLLGWAVSYEGKVKEKNAWRRATACWLEMCSAYKKTLTVLFLFVKCQQS